MYRSFVCEVVVVSHFIFIKYYFLLEKSSEEMQTEREEKKRYLLRKLSFRPSVDELKTRKVSFALFFKPFTS